ncbi:uncharacterized protein FIBRA_04289 [Fibroporia radiculosa]|uniref:G-patch domain-containing protein n=1 Tax=Fibroporia radiculosa TaxID=599839 RepID=J4H2W0_9APHY|nr:uncharacterized protein FIBRA_04289 [Fibroporia radiculosa]CCM02209.1 predicted protein [Fibroporia radiculosa]
MSADSIARWNAIPLNRPETSAEDDNQKRSNIDEENEDESDDNISLVSRSPSPVSHSAKPMDIDKYDEYVKGAARESITIDTKIKSTNKGFLMLASMGWVEGRPLGLSGEGRVDPVPFYVKNDLTGLGKANQDVQMSQCQALTFRPALNSDCLQSNLPSPNAENLTPSVRRKRPRSKDKHERHNSVAKRAALQTEISTTLRAFYCELCDKQFRNVAQYDEHTNSYAHHHKARFRDMQAAQRANRNTKEEVDKRKEKERKREEKELRKIAKAAGVKMAKPPVAAMPQLAENAIGGEGESPSTGSKKSGWASISSTSPAVSSPPAVPAPVSGPGWAPVSAAPSSPRSSDRGWAAASDTAHPASVSVHSQSPPTRTPPPRPSGPAPAFRTGGWTSLDTGSVADLPPAPVCPLPAPPPIAVRPPSPPLPVDPPRVGGWSSVSAPATESSPRDGWNRVPSSVPSPESRTAPSTNVGPSEHPQSVPNVGRVPASHPKPRVPQETSRSGWQQFRAGAPSRRR